MIIYERLQNSICYMKESDSNIMLKLKREIKKSMINKQDSKEQKNHDVIIVMGDFKTIACFNFAQKKCSDYILG